MDEALRNQWLMTEQDQRLSEAVNRDFARLRSFIRRRVPDPGDAEDILQDVFYELIAAYRLMHPIGQVTAWLYRVARNRITDLFRRKTRETRRAEPGTLVDHAEAISSVDLLPSRDAGPDATYARGALLEELAEALDELPEEQRDVFIGHELLGYSFKELADRSGVSVNTLLSRKHYAVTHLRRRLQAIYEDVVKK